MTSTDNPKFRKIDLNTGVTISILASLLVSVAGGAAYMTALQASVISLGETMKDVRISVDRLADQAIRDGRAHAVLETLVVGIEKRVTILEAAMSAMKK